MSACGTRARALIRSRPPQAPRPISPTLILGPLDFSSSDEESASAKSCAPPSTVMMVAAEPPLRKSRRQRLESRSPSFIWIQEQHLFARPSPRRRSVKRRINHLVRQYIRLFIENSRRSSEGSSSAIDDK